jgi:hypothetical protein
MDQSLSILNKHDVSFLPYKINLSACIYTVNKVVVKGTVPYMVGAITEFIEGVKMKYRECICPLSWSVHCNFVRDGKGVGVHCAPPHPHQPGLIFPS